MLLDKGAEVDARDKVGGVFSKRVCTVLAAG